MNDSEGEVQIAATRRSTPRIDSWHSWADCSRQRRSTARKFAGHIDEAGITLAELADSLVRTEAISFRQAHEVASKLARRMIDGATTLSSDPFTEFQEIFAATMLRPARLGERISGASPRRSISSPCAPCRAALHRRRSAASFARYRGEIAENARRSASSASRKRAAEDMLRGEVARRLAGA
jgi:argininosuccinate lyase